MHRIQWFTLPTFNSIDPVTLGRVLRSTQKTLGTARLELERSTLALEANLNRRHRRIDTHMYTYIHAYATCLILPYFYMQAGRLCFGREDTSHGNPI